MILERTRRKRLNLKLCSKVCDVAYCVSCVIIPKRARLLNRIRYSQESTLEVVLYSLLQLYTTSVNISLPHLSTDFNFAKTIHDFSKYFSFLVLAGS